MQISEVLSLPTTRSEAWHENWYSNEALVTTLFGLPGTWSVDIAAAAAVDDRRVTVEEKLFLERDNGRIRASISTIELDGRPFAIWFRDGKRDDTSEITVVDSALLAEATAHIHRWRAYDENVRFLDSDPSADVEVRVAGATLVEENGTKRLVSSEHASSDGVVFVQERAIIASVVAARDADPVLAQEFLTVGFASPLVRAALLAAVVTSMPDDIDHEVLDWIGDPTVGWTAVVAATDEGAYAIGLEAWQLRSKGYRILGDLSARRIGDPDLIERYRGEAPTP